MTGERWVPGRPHRLIGEFSFHYSENNFAPAISPGIYARFRLIDGSRHARTAFIMDLDIAARSIGIAGASSSFRVGNPYIGIRMGARGRHWVARGGIGSAPPLTNAFADGPGDARAYFAGEALLGGWDLWLISDENVPLVFRGDFEYHHRWFTIGGDTAFAAIFPVTRDAPARNTQGVFQTGFFFGFTPIDEIAIGLRAQFVFASRWRAIGDVDDAQYAMLLPFFRVALEPVFFELRFLVNFGDAFGFVPRGSVDPVWAFSFWVGGQF
jgi:hypothetical protein